ncbi:MAG: InlB B-repeat-containing protein [Bacilli bacterium]|nr:InlB B-repeat-containing protein [Bacilli bacterium]
MKKRILPLLVVSALSLGIGVTTLTSCDVEIPVEAGPDFTDSKPVSVVSIEKTGTSGLVDTYTITYSDGTTSKFTVTNGADGEKGETGATGAQGIQGQPGQDGHTPVITIGANGHWFIDGVDSNVSAEGAKGETGPQGPAGDKGDTGATGPQGPAGEKGDTGEQGEPGTPGSSFLSGLTNPSDSEGRDGDTYLNITTGDIFKKNDGFWEKMGNMKGGDSTSSTFLSGDRTPTADEGKDGDVYLNTLTKEMYVKVNGVWVLQGYLNGVPGEGESHIHNFSDYTVVDDEDGINVDIVKKCHYCDEVDASTIFAQREKVVFATLVPSTENTGSQYFELGEDGWYTSTNHAGNSSAYLYLKVETGGTLKFDYNVSSESSNYDYLYVGIVGNGSYILKEGGYVTNTSDDVGKSGTKELEVTAGQEIYFQYRKDSSGDRGRDEAKFKITGGTTQYNVMSFQNVSGTVEETPTPMFIENGSLIGELPTLTKPNDKEYFGGWYVDPTLTTPITTATSFEGDVVAYAKWLEPVYITCDLNYGGQSATKAMYKYRPGDTPVVGEAGIQSPTREGYIFYGWYTDRALTTPYEPGAIEEDTTIYARWIKEEDAHTLYGTYTGVRFSNTYESLSTYSTTLNVDALGKYTLNPGRSDEKSGQVSETVIEGTAEFTAEGMSNIVDCGDYLIFHEASTYTAYKYTYIVAKTGVTGNKIAQVRVNDKDDAITLVDVTVNGTSHTIAFDNKLGTVRTITQDVSVSDFNGNIVAINEIKNTPAVKITKGEETLYSLTAKGVDDSKYAFSSTENDGLAGIYTNGDSYVNLSGAGLMKFKNLPTVKDTTTSSETVSSTTKYTVDEVDTNVIYVSYGSSSSSTAIRAKITLNLEDHTFTTSAWQHTVTFDYNYIEEGETESKKIEATGYHGVSLWFSSVKNEKDERIDEITREGYIFDGWYDNPECTGSEVRSSVSNTEDTVLYAKWVVPVTITIHANNGTEDTVLTGKPEGFVTGLSNPTREGFVFAGWYTDEACTAAWNKNFGTENIDVYAKWVEAFDYSEYVGSYKGGEIWSTDKNKDRSNAYQTISSDGSFTGTRWTNTFSGSYLLNSNVVKLSDSKEIYLGQFDDGRKFMVMNYYYNTSSGNPISEDNYVQIKVETGETISALTQTMLYSNNSEKIFAVKFSITNSGVQTEYNMVIDSKTDKVYTDVTYIINNEIGTFADLYNGSSYADTIVIKKGEEQLYSFNGGGSSLTPAE